MTNVANTKAILLDNFYQKWNESATLSSKGKYYTMFKDKPRLEEYLLSLPYNLAKWIVKLRTANHRLPIEKGRWFNVNKDHRFCTLCNSYIGDEFHFLLQCPSLHELRNKYLPSYYCKYPTIEKFNQLMVCSYKPLVIKLAKYLKDGLQLFK